MQANFYFFFSTFLQLFSGAFSMRAFWVKCAPDLEKKGFYVVCPGWGRERVQ